MTANLSNKESSKECYNEENIFQLPSKMPFGIIKRAINHLSHHDLKILNEHMMKLMGQHYLIDHSKEQIAQMQNRVLRANEELEKIKGE